MDINTAIQKAIDGGYLFKARYRSSSRSVAYEDKDENTAIKTISEIFLDRFFWRSLGKALGWDFLQMLHYGDRFSHRERAEWEHYWHRFIDHLADGGTAESFFKDL